MFLKPSQVADLRLAASQMTGVNRRASSCSNDSQVLSGKRTKSRKTF